MARRARGAGATALVIAGIVGAGTAVGASSTMSAQVASIGADSASVVTYRNGSKRLVMARLASGVELTRVTPGHDRSRIPVPQWVASWKRMYGKAGPNAVLTYGTGARAVRVSWTLASAQYSAKKGQLAFMLRPMAVGGRRPLPVIPAGARRKKATVQALGPAVLFID